MKKTLLLLLSIFTIGATTLAPVTVSALDCGATPDAPACQVRKGARTTEASNGKTLPQNIKTVVNVLLFLIGAIAVLMIIIGGIRYVLSNGEAAQITSAKNTVLYAVIGLIVALLAYAIVNFVVTQFAGS